MYSLKELGYDIFFSETEEETNLKPARVLAAHRGQYEISGEFGLKDAVVSGRMEFICSEPDDFPTVGDWVYVRFDEQDGPAIIERVLERRSKIVRKKSGKTSDAQIIAANIDYAFIVQSCNSDLNPRRIERYLAAIAQHQVTPIILLSKCELLTDREAVSDQVKAVSENHPHIFFSSVTGENLQVVLDLMKPGTTSVLIGSSGVGKTTLVNALCQDVNEETQDIRAGDDKGRHTTTGRKIFLARSGGLIIDTPGMREFGLFDSDVEGSGLFSDIAELAETCRYRNCHHESEPGCAVLQAVADGSLDQDRLASLRKLRKEEAFEKRRHDSKASNDAKKKWKTIHKEMRHHPKKHRWD